MIIKHQLRNINLMDFSQAMTNVQSFLAKEDLTAMGLEALKKEFDQKREDLEEALKPIRKSEHTKSMNKLNQKRDMMLMGYIGHCKLFRRFPEEEKAKTAEKLVLINEKYGKSPQKQSLRAKTAIIRNIIADISSPEMKLAVSSIGADKWVEFLTQYNEEFALLHTNRTEEKGSVVVGRTKEARNALQVVFSKVVSAINGLAIVQGEDKFKNLANSINEEIKRVTAKRKSDKKDEKPPIINEK